MAIFLTSCIFGRFLSYSQRCCCSINVEKTFDFRINCVSRCIVSGCPNDPDVRTVYLAVVAWDFPGPHGSPLRRFLLSLGVQGGDGGHAAEQDLGGDGDVQRPIVELVMETRHRPLMRLMMRLLGPGVLTSPRGPWPVVVVLVLELGVVVVVAAGDIVVVVVVVVLVGGVFIIGVWAIFHVGLEVLVLLVWHAESLLRVESWRCEHRESWLVTELWECGD